MGVNLQPLAAQVCAMNINGVTIQCAIHSELAIAPMVSDLKRTNFIIDMILTQHCCKYRCYIC